MSPRMVLVSLAATLLLAADASAALVHGELGQLAGAAGCVDEGGGSAGCEDGFNFGNSTNQVVLSPDGKHVYASGQNGVLVFGRNATTGELTQTACYRATAGTAEGDATRTCEAVPALAGAIAVAIAPDGLHVYVAGRSSVVEFSRSAATGLLASNGCVNIAGSGGCTNARHLYDAWDMAFSKDGQKLYVTNNAVPDGRTEYYFNDGVAVFDVASDGTLTQPAGLTGCLSDTGRATDADADAGVDGLIDNSCTNVRALQQANGVVVSPDGKHAYVQSASRQLSVYAIDQTTGALEQLGCLNGQGTAQDSSGADNITSVCTLVRSSGDWSIEISDDGRWVFTGNTSGWISAFSRDATTGALTQSSARDACISVDGTANDDADMIGCATGRAIARTWHLADAPDGRNLYALNYEGASPVANPAGIAVLDFDPSTGLLSQSSAQRGCVTPNGSEGACQTGRALDAAVNDALVSPDGSHLIALSAYGIASFSRGMPPTCSNGAASTAFGAPVAITLSCSDPNGDALTVTVGAPAHGALSGTAPSVTYTPAAGYSGADAFSYSASDGANASGAASAAITVGAAPPATAPPVITPIASPPLLTVGTPAVVGGTVEVDKKGRFFLKLSCPAGGGACKGTVKVRSATAVSAAKKKVLALAAKGYSVAAGKTARVRLTLSAKGRKLLNRAGKVKALATFAPTGGGKKTTRKLTLKKA